MNRGIQNFLRCMLSRPQWQDAGKQKIPGVENVLLVGSGKGGVGKSTLATNLAVSLATYVKKEDGNDMRIGLMDADIFGPSIHKMMDVEEEELVGRKIGEDEYLLQPIEKYGIYTVSAGNFLQEGSPIIWRGSMVSNAISQLLFDVEWEDLDLLIIDLPPGTGDVQITLSQSVEVDGAVIVSTPQDISLLDVERSVNMFKKVDVPVLGIVENMSGFTCPHCQEETNYFGKGGAEILSEKVDVDFLAEIPFQQKTMEGAENGFPSCLSEDASKNFKDLAELIWKRLDEK